MKVGGVEAAGRFWRNCLHPIVSAGLTLRAAGLWVSFFCLVLEGSAQNHAVGLVQLLNELSLLVLGQEAGLGRFDVLEDKHTHTHTKQNYIHKKGPMAVALFQ